VRKISHEKCNEFLRDLDDELALCSSADVLATASTAPTVSGKGRVASGNAGFPGPPLDQDVGKSPNSSVTSTMVGSDGEKQNVDDIATERFDIDSQVDESEDAYFPNIPAWQMAMMHDKNTFYIDDASDAGEPCSVEYCPTVFASVKALDITALTLCFARLDQAMEGVSDSLGCAETHGGENSCEQPTYNEFQEPDDKEREAIRTNILSLVHKADELIYHTYDDILDRILDDDDFGSPQARAFDVMPGRMLKRYLSYDSVGVYEIAEYLNIEDVNGEAWDIDMDEHGRGMSYRSTDLYA